jgi:hypothetical protein
VILPLYILHPFPTLRYSPIQPLVLILRPEYLPVVQGSGLCLPVYTPVYTEAVDTACRQIEELDEASYDMDMLQA